LAFITGPSGSGKTAIALLTVRDCLLKRDVFPVYWRVSSTGLTLTQETDVGQIVAEALLAYIAVEPIAFLEQEVEGKAAIAHLLGYFIGTGAELALRLHQAGLPRIGIGSEMLKEIKRLTRGISSRSSPGPEELLRLLSEARPCGDYTVILLDVQAKGKKANPEDGLRALWRLAATLERRAVFIKAFLPAELFAEPVRRLGEVVPIKRLRVAWPGEALEQMLKNRLAFFETDSLSQWCVPWEKDLKLDERLVQRATGSPRRLMELGNALLERIGEKARLGEEEKRLTGQDLDELLGEYYEQ